jgi:hypothetical protein
VELARGKKNIKGHSGNLCQTAGLWEARQYAADSELGPRRQLYATNG